jgi:hypothetical protein
MRVKNSTQNNIQWTLSFYATCFHGWSERASISLNGNLDWQCPGDQYANTHRTVSLNIPANRVSTVIAVAASSPPSGQLRTNLLAFTGNCFNLPNGLSFVDDLDTTDGNIWNK